MAAAGLLRLLLMAQAPATDSLRDIVRWVEGSVQLGPWVTLEAGIYHFWRSVTLSNAKASDWWSAPPGNMPSTLQLLSLLLRLPSFIFDVAIAITLYFVVTKHASPREGRYASLLWFLNPYTLFAVEMLGVPDVAALFLTVLAVALLHRQRIILAGLFLAAGIAIKLYPILLIPPVLLYCKRRLEIRRRSELALMLLSLLGLAVYLTWGFQGIPAAALLTEYTPVTQPFSELFVYIMGTGISPAAIALIVVYFAIWLLARVRQIADVILPVFLVYYAFSNPHPQYYVWALPFLILDIVLVERRHLNLLTATYALVLLYWFLSSAGFPTPSGYSLLFFPLQGQNLPWYSQAIKSFLASSANSYLLMPLLYPVLAAVIFIYALEIVRYWFRSETGESQPSRHW
jgi:hypothetical protein